MPTFDYLNLKQLILKNHIDSLQNKIARMEDITRELLRLGEVFDTDEPRHLAGLIHYFGIGVVVNKKKAIVIFRKIAANSNLLEALTWLMTIYLQDDPEHDLCASPKTAEDYYRKAKKVYNEERHGDYAPYIKFAEMVAQYIGDKGKKKSAKKIYEQMICGADAMENMEIRLLLEEFQKICQVSEAHDNGDIVELLFDARKSVCDSFESNTFKMVEDKYSNDTDELEIFGVPQEKYPKIFDV